MTTFTKKRSQLCSPVCSNTYVCNVPVDLHADVVSDTLRACRVSAAGGDDLAIIAEADIAFSRLFSGVRLLPSRTTCNERAAASEQEQSGVHDSTRTNVNIPHFSQTDVWLSLVHIHGARACVHPHVVSNPSRQEMEARWHGDEPVSTASTFSSSCGGAIPNSANSTAKRVIKTSASHRHGEPTLNESKRGRGKRRKKKKKKRRRKLFVGQAISTQR